MKAILLAATILLSLAGQNPFQEKRSSKNNPALSNVEADPRACSGATCQTEIGADTQVCAYHKHRKLFAPLLIRHRNLPA